MFRRDWLRQAAACGAATSLAAVCRPAAAAFPDRPITLVAPFPAGGSADAYARIVAKALSDELRQPVVVVNRPGVSGALGIQSVIRSEADGYTLSLAGTGAMVLMPLTSPKPLFDPLKDVTLLGQVVDTPVVFVAGAKVAEKTVQDFIAQARLRPGAFSIASTGVGGGTHVLAELFQQATGTRLLHVPYQGVAPVLQDLLGGAVDVFFGEIPALLPQIRAGKLTPLFSATPRRLKWLPDVPSAPEVGLAQVYLSGEYGLVGPRALPTPVAEHLESALARALATDEVRVRLDQSYGIPRARSARAYRTHIQSEMDRWAPVIRSANITTE